MSFKYVKEGDKRPIASVVVCGRVPSVPEEEPVLPPVEEPQIPSEPIETPSTSPETGESEEEPMEENKPQNQPEMSPVEGWNDPEPGAGTTIVERISALMSVKSIITLAFVGTYLAMVLQGQQVPSLFENILTMIVSFFFGYQFRKAEK